MTTAPKFYTICKTYSRQCGKSINNDAKSVLYNPTLPNLLVIDSQKILIPVSGQLQESRSKHNVRNLKALLRLQFPNAIIRCGKKEKMQ